MNPTKNDRFILNDNGDFIISDYNRSKLFSSFFPGVAGKEGIPMWLFYVNRGQCVCSMGIEGKNKPIMEFLPANWAYNLVSSQGFRTFLKFRTKDTYFFYEPFQRDLQNEEMLIEQKMIIKPAGLTLIETNQSLQLRFIVEYSNVPQDKYAGLIRELKIENLSDTSISFDLLDGLPLIIPYGLDNNGLKFMRRLFEAFVEVTNYQTKVPFFKGKVEPSDRPDVVRIKKGNFYLGFRQNGKNVEIVTPVVDPVKIFGNRGDYKAPEVFLKSSIDEVVKGQILENRLPSAMGIMNVSINAGDSFTYTSVIGHAESVEELNNLVPIITSSEYIEQKKRANAELIDRLTQNNFICSEESVLDYYARQNFLDNALRGGLPYTIHGANSSSTLHLYSRKHGDLERDYNDYRLTPTHYSQGNGNYRDVNQNRRSDLFFNPDVKDSNIEHFYNLIQLDGFNPLVIKEIRFAVKYVENLESVLGKHIENSRISFVKEYIRNPFTPGELLSYLKENRIEISTNTEGFIGDLIGICIKKYDTAYGEGYWTDHWTYNLDLIENYLAVYPEEKQQLLFNKKEYTYYDNPHLVAPRDDKYVIWDGNLMQLNSVEYDEEKEELINQRPIDRNKVHTDYGKGEVYKTNLFNKMLCLIINKLASLDGSGVGIEMESGKPNWYDALNGLPGLIGSSLSETLEVKRHILFMLNSLSEGTTSSFALPEELYDFALSLMELLNSNPTPFNYWDSATTLKEQYRKRTRLGISGREIQISFEQVVSLLKSGLKRVEDGISRAWNREQNVISTYFINKVIKHELIYTTAANGEQVVKRNANGLPCFKALKFELVHLPLFLEGPVHFLRTCEDRTVSQELVQNIRLSGLFDTKLKMYKVNESLKDQPMEIGRARTFSPGWFENESIWLHMEYKYMLEVLRNELHEEFFDDFKNVFIPFLKPEIYGRSILENSSFIVSSGNPDSSIHGNGFVARLSGATAEFISILMHMATGRTPFSIDVNGDLILMLKPILPKWIFTKNNKEKRLYLREKWQNITFPANSFSFVYLGEVLVIYHNPGNRDTFGKESIKPISYTLEFKDGSRKIINNSYLSGDLAKAVRDRLIVRMDVLLG
ncbi:MAG: cellobiose phosphorylase [Candidatus Cloacimonetes bacterium]|nr:cellobiose phosphorylase [Candidatus Cloacimonadota bacterium]